MRGAEAKDLLKRGAKSLLAIGGKLIPMPYNKRRILTYHSVGHRAHAMNVTPENFQAQMEWLSRHYPVIPLEQAAEGVEGVAITFDDGYRDNLVHAAPVLRRLGFAATVFVVPGRLGGVLTPQDDPATGAMLKPEDLPALEAMGISIGAHTLTHPHLSRLRKEVQREEIEVSGLMLQKVLGHPISAFAYPYGTQRDYNAITMRLVRESGYVFAVSNRYGPNRAGADRWQLRRIWIDASDTLASFKAKVSGNLDLLALFDTEIGLKVRSSLNRFLLKR